ncbi:helix-turn-helix transcriptional regulator [Streptomyces sp. NPDC057474]|uniref:helix-turn-helix transcriptional regulator n=1 Tax=Streptomyces sp. NPDC057474 TaxID=3346144 RepID=UPI003677FD01
MDRAQLADFLRTRREALQPEDVGLPRGPRRRSQGLRREEIAMLAGMSVDYYARIEQQRGPTPSEPILASIARALHLTQDERNHLFEIAGHQMPGPTPLTDHVSPGMMRILDRLADTPAQVLTALDEALVQTRSAVALVGNDTTHTGLSRSLIYRWFTDPRARRIYPEADHSQHSRAFVSDLRVAYTRQGPGSRAGEIAEALLAGSTEFTTLWNKHEIGVRRPESKRFAHPDLGVLELQCQTLLDPGQDQILLVYTATPGTESYDKFQLLSVVGDRQPHR